MIHFPRAELAETLVQAMQGKAVFSDAHNGLFLAAPRRTGKTTFLRSDLTPALEAQGITVVYVDLWSNPRRDPGELIAEAIASSLRQHQGFVARAASAAGLESVNVGGVLKIDTRQIGKLEGASLADALGALIASTRSPLALIVDEAQHALTSEQGEAAMSALKSARDQLNSPGDVRLMLVMSGSDRDKLLRLVNANAAPFFGSQIQRMPELGEDFTRHVAALIEAQRPDLAPIDAEVLFKAFQLFGARPQFFMDAVGRALNPLSGVEGRFELITLDAALQRQQDDEAQMESDFLGLKPIEQAVLWRLLEQGARFRPYDAEALRFYHQKTGSRVSAQKAQAALESLRQRNPALVWKSARGEYSVEDAAMHRWHQDRVGSGTWPPVSKQDSPDSQP